MDFLKECKNYFIDTPDLLLFLTDRNAWLEKNKEYINEQDLRDEEEAMYYNIGRMVYKEAKKQVLASMEVEQ